MCYIFISRNSAQFSKQKFKFEGELKLDAEEHNCFLFMTGVAVDSPSGLDLCSNVCSAYLCCVTPGLCVMHQNYGVVIAEGIYLKLGE